MKDDLIIHEKLNWKDITPEEFEQLVYFILDVAGAKNIIWRKGGEGISSNDQGRDLECTFHNVRDDGRVEEEHCWVEVKYRRKTLEKIAVERSVINSKEAPSHINKFLIVTNTQVSTSTLEWVKKFDEKYPSPKTVIWQFFELERIILNNPHILLRFFPTALTIKGKAWVIKSQFIYNLTLPSVEEISDLWANIKKIDFDPLLWLPVIITEVNFGDITKRQWLLGYCDKRQLLEILFMALCNLPLFFYRGAVHSRNQQVLIKGVAYIVEIATFILGSDTMSEILQNPQDFCLPKLKMSDDELVKLVLRPIFIQIFEDFLYPCVYNCEKVNIYNEEMIESTYNKFWDRFKIKDKNSESDLRYEDSGSLYIENIKMKCPVTLSEKCPIFQFKRDEFNLKNLGRYLKVIESIILYNVKK